MELEREKYVTKKLEVEKLAKIIEELVELSNETTKMSQEQVIDLIEYYENQINSKL